jgi:two-component system, response regulator PdtaR
MNSLLRDPESLRAHAPPLANPRAWRVLIAEDEALPAELLKRILIRLGHLVVGTAQNGVEAIAMTRQLSPDVVVMDLRMPVMDGWAAMSELTREMLTPIVVVSALDDRESLEQAVFAGASAFLTKPVREDDLERALELAVARFGDLREIRQLRAEAEQRVQEQTAQLQELERVIQELRQAQVQLASAARRAAVTSLAHGLAHEINNALTPIIGNAQIIALLHDKNAETLDRTQQIIEHARRIAGWTASFRQVTTGSKRERMEFSFNGIAQEVFALYGERFQRLGIAAQTNLDDTLPPIEGHPDQIQEALMLLLQNAVEALRSGGEVQLTTQYDPGQLTLLAHLSDSGSGIAAEHLPHVFEPGFTTKAGVTSAPLGWGLFTARHIIHAHHGHIRISSPAENSTRGTSVHIVLPLHPPIEV